MIVTRIGFSNILLLVNMDLFIWTLLIDFADILLSLTEQFTSYILHVPCLRSLSNTLSNLWILWEDLFLQESFSNCHCLDVCLGHVDKLTFLVEANVVVTDI